MIISYNISDWPYKFAILLTDKINEILKIYNTCNILLTGGRSATELYLCISELKLFDNINNINFYFGDERFVNLNDENSNYRLVKDTLFKNINMNNFNIFPMIEDNVSIDNLSEKYTKILPSRIDIILLSMGEDGHIASIFPNSIAFEKDNEKVVPIICNKYPYQRLTITPSVIKSASNVFLLVKGMEKNKLFKNLTDNIKDFRTIPARLVFNHNCILIPE